MMLFVSLPVALLAVCQNDSYGPPPGMVAIPSKAIQVGGDPEEIEALIRKDELVAGNIAAELGMKTQAVASFYLSIFETTNEQYLRFVNAAGYRPPLSWGQKAIDDAKRAYVEAAVGQKNVAAFDESDWWRSNWRKSDWSMPTNIATLPVVYVDYYDADAYCKWAGLRLMTEFEFQAAGRATARQRYTWGDDWQRGMAITSDPDQRPAPVEVGSIAKAASLHGVFDLCGNVWEWTTSPYVQLPGYKDLKIKVKQGKKEREIAPTPKWDSSMRVVVGGSFANTQVAARLSTRRPTAREDMFSGLGFRAAASAAVGVGRAEAMKADMPFGVRGEAEPNSEGTLGFERWIVGEGRAEKANYSVIEEHNWLLWIPATEVKESTESGLRNESKEKPVGLGYITTTVPIAYPALEPGTYLVAWRTDGEPKRVRAKPEEKPKGDDGGDAPPIGGAGGALGEAGGSAASQERTPVVDVDPFGGIVNYEFPSLIFYDLELKPVASIIANTPDQRTQSKTVPFGSFVLLPAGAKVEGREKSLVAPSLEVLRYSIFVRDGSKQAKGFALEFDLGLAPGVIDPTWRR